MAKQVILAVAGAGKTFHICREIDVNKKNLILAFTHENINNITKELLAAYNCIPELTRVSTFDSFIYHEMVLPYEPSIASHFNKPDFVSRGICTIDPPNKRIEGKNGQMIPNPKYIKKEKLGHYITQRQQYYCATLPELVLQVKQGKESLLKKVANRLNLFYDSILIDEFQDFREYDYELLMELSKQLNHVILVGDYYQHSVAAFKNSGKPFAKGKGKNKTYVSYNEFVNNLMNMGFEVDVNSLVKSRRCSDEVCKYVSKKLNINISSSGDNEGAVIWVKDNAKEIIENPNIVKLVFNNDKNYTFNALNWSYSKGDTVNSACVILIDDFERLDQEIFSPNKIAASTINKLYVAMTRSKGNLYLMKSSIFNSLKNSYLKSNSLII